MPKVDKTYVSAYSVETFLFQKQLIKKKQADNLLIICLFVPEIGLEPTQLLHH